MQGSGGLQAVASQWHGQGRRWLGWRRRVSRRLIPPPPLPRPRVPPRQPPLPRLLPPAAKFNRRSCCTARRGRLRSCWRGCRTLMTRCAGGRRRQLASGWGGCSDCFFWQHSTHRFAAGAGLLTPAPRSPSPHRRSALSGGADSRSHTLARHRDILHDFQQASCQLWLVLDCLMLMQLLAGTCAVDTPALPPPAAAARPPRCSFVARPLQEFRRLQSIVGAARDRLDLLGGGGSSGQGPLLQVGAGGGGAHACMQAAAGLAGERNRGRRFALPALALHNPCWNDPRVFLLLFLRCRATAAAWGCCCGSAACWPPPTLRWMK